MLKVQDRITTISDGVVSARCLDPEIPDLPNDQLQAIHDMRDELGAAIAKVEKVITGQKLVVGLNLVRWAGLNKTLVEQSEPEGDLGRLRRRAAWAALAAVDDNTRLLRVKSGGFVAQVPTEVRKLKDAVLRTGWTLTDLPAAGLQAWSQFQIDVAEAVGNAEAIADKGIIVALLLVATAQLNKNLIVAGAGPDDRSQVQVRVAWEALVEADRNARLCVTYKTPGSS